MGRSGRAPGKPMMLQNLTCRAGSDGGRRMERMSAQSDHDGGGRTTVMVWFPRMAARMNAEGWLTGGRCWAGRRVGTRLDAGEPQA